jgi:hypothetical protein
MNTTERIQLNKGTPGEPCPIAKTIVTRTVLHVEGGHILA